MKKHYIVYIKERRYRTTHCYEEVTEYETRRFIFIFLPFYFLSVSFPLVGARVVFGAGNHRRYSTYV